MTLEELDQQREELYNNYRKDLASLENKYAQSIAKYNVGDIIKGHQGTLKIDNIRLSGDYVLYSGMKLKADLTEPKKQEKIYADKNAILIKSRP